MAVLLLALASAFFVGLNNVLIRKALDSTSRGQAILVSLATAFFVFLVANAVLGNLRLFFAPAAGLFLLAGLFGPGLGRTLNIASAKRIGVSRTIPIVGTAPFFATVLAIVFLDENYSFALFLGMLLIVFGIFALSRRKNRRTRVFVKRDLLIPVAAAACGGISIATTKLALNELNNPTVGVGITLGAAFFAVLGYIVGTRRLQRVRVANRGSFFSVLGGFSMCAAFFLNFSALQMGHVSVVAPVFSVFPLFGVLFSHFLLREQITGRIWLAAIMIVLGIAVIQAF